MIRTVLYLRTKQDIASEVADFYARYDVLSRSIEESGGLEAELSRNADDGRELMVTALWPSEASYRAWVENPFRSESNADLAKLLGSDSVGVGALYSVMSSARTQAGDGE